MVESLGGEFDGLAISDFANDGVAGLASGPLGGVSHWGLLEEGFLLEEAEQAAVFGVHRRLILLILLNILPINIHLRMRLSFDKE